MVTISRHVCVLLLDRASLEPDRGYSRNGHPTRAISGNGCVNNARRATASYPVALFLFNDNCEKTLRTTGFRQLLAARLPAPPLLWIAAAVELRLQPGIIDCAHIHTNLSPVAGCASVKASPGARHVGSFTESKRVIIAGVRSGKISHVT